MIWRRTMPDAFADSTARAEMSDWSKPVLMATKPDFQNTPELGH